MDGAEAEEGGPAGLTLRSVGVGAGDRLRRPGGGWVTGHPTLMVSQTDGIH